MEGCKRLQHRRKEDKKNRSTWVDTSRFESRGHRDDTVRRIPAVPSAVHVADLQYFVQRGEVAISLQWLLV